MKFTAVFSIAIVAFVASTFAMLPGGMDFQISDPGTICYSLSQVNGVAVSKTCNDINVSDMNLDYTTYGGWTLYKSYTWFNYSSAFHADGTTYPDGASWPVVASTGAVDFTKFQYRIESYPAGKTTQTTTYALDVPAGMLPLGAADYCNSRWRQYTCFYLKNAAGTLVKPFNSAIYYSILCTPAGNPI